MDRREVARGGLICPTFPTRVGSTSIGTGRGTAPTDLGLFYQSQIDAPAMDGYDAPLCDGGPYRRVEPRPSPLPALYTRKETSPVIGGLGHGLINWCGDVRFTPQSRPISRPVLMSGFDPFRKSGTGTSNTGGAESIPVCWWIGSQRSCLRLVCVTVQCAAACVPAARKLVSGRLTISEASIWTFVKATAMRRQFGP